MFQALVDQARTLIQRLHVSVRQGYDDVSEAERVRPSEIEAWDSASEAIVELVFGAGSAEVSRWHGLAQRRAALVGDAIRRDIKRGEYFGLIDYFHLAIGLLLELDARYRIAQDSARGRTAPDLEYDDEHSHSPWGWEDESAARGSKPRAAQMPAVVHSPNGQWEVTVAIRATTYRWLAEVAAMREPASPNDVAITRLAATILDRVAVNTRDERPG